MFTLGRVNGYHQNILNFLVRQNHQHGPVRISNRAISNMTGVNRNTTYRCVRDLTDEGYVNVSIVSGTKEFTVRPDIMEAFNFFVT